MKAVNKSILFLLLVLIISEASAQTGDTLVKSKKWYDVISLRGYLQVRYNRLLETNPQLKCEQCDNSLGEGGGFFLRRARLVFSGQVTKNVFVYLQPDFASTANGTLHYLQLRDAFVDLSIGKEQQYRLRIGQSKIPYGFENMQSSSVRIPLDRADALNSSIANERDLGAFFYYAPGRIRKLFDRLTDDGLKGSGDFGVIAVGVFNGQNSNQPEVNNRLHKVVRLSYPFEIGNQIIEAGIQAYTGTYSLQASDLSTGTAARNDFSYDDERVAASFVVYPQPFGIQAEYNIGVGPEYDAASDSIMTKKLRGGYSTFSYLTKINKQVLIPYLKMQYYRGGKKHELDARAYQTQEYEIGIEWQPIDPLEITAGYMISQRWTSDGSNEDNLQRGQALRLQAQISF